MSSPFSNPFKFGATLTFHPLNGAPKWRVSFKISNVARKITLDLVDRKCRPMMKRQGIKMMRVSVSTVLLQGRPSNHPETPEERIKKNVKNTKDKMNLKFCVFILFLHCSWKWIGFNLAWLVVPRNFWLGWVLFFSGNNVEQISGGTARWTESVRHPSRKWIRRIRIFVAF